MGSSIADYGLLSDCHSAALVGRDGSVDWLCLPRFDSPSIFGRILDARAGYFFIRPVGSQSNGEDERPVRVTRRYRPMTLVLETTFETDTGAVLLVDALEMGPNERGHELGAHAPRTLLREVRGLRGSVELELDCAPRPEYGRVLPMVRGVDGGALIRGGADVLTLSTSVPLQCEFECARARFTVRAGESAAFALQHRTSAEGSPAWYAPERITRCLDDTTEGWSSWSSEHQGYSGPWAELVHHSGRVLQALTYYPTGAIVAAPTTSLPETVGGERNWDYRFSWVRDASLTLEALWVAACPDEASRFFDYLAGAAISQVHRGTDLQIMFGVGGEHDLSERELPHLTGWRGSRPVRIGNAAWQQRQLDVYGELLGAAERLRHHLTMLDPSTSQFLTACADTAATRWRERDQGIWEVRGEPRDFLHSKLMCWVALDRAIELAPLLGAEDRVDRWAVEREAIRKAILAHGWNEGAGAFTQAFGLDSLDASCLMMPIVGFLPATDPRMLSTIHAVAERLCDEQDLIYRYRASDGLEGEEGTFLLCTFWLAHCLALAGELGRAREVFNRAARFANDLGLLSEEVDGESGELLGNFPQAFSHIGLVNAAWAIAEAEARRAEGVGPSPMP